MDIMTILIQKIAFRTPRVNLVNKVTNEYIYFKRRHIFLSLPSHKAIITSIMHYTNMLLELEKGTNHLYNTAMTYNL